MDLFRLLVPSGDGRYLTGEPNSAFFRVLYGKHTNHMELDELENKIQQIKTESNMVVNTYWTGIEKINRIHWKQSPLYWIPMNICQQIISYVANDYEIEYNESQTLLDWYKDAATSATGIVSQAAA